MSASADTGSDAQLAAELAEIAVIWSPAIFEQYVSIGAFAFMLYDYFLTLPDEIEEIWQGKFTITKALYLMNRYPFMLSLFTFILFIFTNMGDSVSQCNGLYMFTSSINYLNVIAVLAIFTIRTFAIYGRNWLILVLLSVLGVAIVAVTIAQQVLTTGVTALTLLGVDIPPLKCVNNAPANLATWQLASYGLTLSFDTIVFVLTFARTIRLTFEARKAEVKNSLSALLLRDGFVYYVFSLLPSIVVIVLYAVSMKAGSAQSVSDADYAFTYIYNVVQWCMVNRLITNLCHTGAKGSVHYSGVGEPGNQSNHPEMVFASGSIWGNIAESVRIDVDTDTFTSDQNVGDEAAGISALRYGEEIEFKEAGPSRHV